MKYQQNTKDNRIKEFSISPAEKETNKNSSLMYTMDSINNSDEISISQVAIYASLSFIIVSLLGLLIYITCSKRYKLNWFEKNLLESAKETDSIDQR